MRDQVVLRDMRAQDVPAARELSREQKWPHRTADWTFLCRHGRGVVAESDGKLVGTAMCWRYGENAATVGMVIVSPHCQGQGIGRKLMMALLDSLSDRTVMLNATEEGLPLYTKLGFEPIGTIHQHQGKASPMPLPKLLPKERVRPLGGSDVEVVAELDRNASGMDRRNLLVSLVKVSKGVILDRDNEAVGFALFRRFGRGYSVGPAVAPDVGGAKALITHWLGSQAGKFCRLDVSAESGLSDWLEELELPCVGRVTTMVRGTPPKGIGDVKLYSLISQALG